MRSLQHSSPNVGLVPTFSPLLCAQRSHYPRSQPKRVQGSPQKCNCEHSAIIQTVGSKSAKRAHCPDTLYSSFLSSNTQSNRLDFIWGHLFQSKLVKVLVLFFFNNGVATVEFTGRIFRDYVSSTPSSNNLHLYNNTILHCYLLNAKCSTELSLFNHSNHLKYFYPQNRGKR